MATESPNSFGRQLRELRQSAGLSQEELAERAGLTGAAIGALERGERRQPYPHTVSAISAALGLDEGARRKLIELARGREASNDARDAGIRASSAPVPRPMTPFFGRDEDLALVETLLGQREVRWVTLTGPGGVGKTRLAMEVAGLTAEKYEAGASWIDLSSVAAEEHVLPAIARGLGIAETRGVEPLRLLAGHLKRTRMLLVLDNFEQLVGAWAQVSELLQVCPGLDVLVTSREALRVRGEHEVRLSPLVVPEPGAPGTGDSSAVRLLVDRIRAVAPRFELTDENAAAVAAICARLDGLPLALELAAGQMRYLTPRALLDRLDRSQPVLGGGGRDLPARQRSLEATVRWSYDLLSAGEQLLFRRLGAFSGSFAIDAVETVCADGELAASDVAPTLFSLADKSLVQARPGEETRFGMLQVIRGFARGTLDESGEAAELRARHASWFAGAAERLESNLQGRGREAALTQLDRDEANLASAIDWCASGGDRCVGLRLVAALAWFWLFRGNAGSAERWTSRLLEEPPAACDDRAIGGAFYTAAAVAWKKGDLERAEACAAEAVKLLRKAADQRRFALALAISGLVAVSARRPADAVPAHRESLALFEAMGHAWGTGYAESNLGDALFELRDVEAASTLYDRALEAFTRERDPWGQAIVQHTLGNIALREGAFVAARGRYEAAVELCREMRNQMEVARGLIGVGAASLAMGDLDEAEWSLRESLAAWRDFDNADGIALCLRGLAAVAAVQGERRTAESLLAEAQEFVEGMPAVYAFDAGVFEPYLA